MNNNDTICALATAQGGAIGVIRISGEDAINNVAKCFEATSGKKLEEVAAQCIIFGNIKDEEGNIIDEVLVSVFRAPHSYTGENTVEISCHGSTYILNTILQTLLL